MRRVFQRIVLRRPVAGFDLANLFTNGDHRSNKAVEFGLRLRLGRLDHHRSGHREADGRRVKAVVHQPFGDVDLGNPGRGLDRANIENAFVRHAPLFARVQHRVVLLQAAGDVVGVEDGHLCCARQSAAAHHGNIHPRDGQDRRRPPRCRGNRPLPGVRAADRLHAVIGHEGGEMRLEPDRPHARSATAVRDAEGLVQVHVADVGADQGG